MGGLVGLRETSAGAGRAGQPQLELQPRDRPLRAAAGPAVVAAGLGDDAVGAGGAGRAAGENLRGAGRQHPAGQGRGEGFERRQVAQVVTPVPEALPAAEKSVQAERGMPLFGQQGSSAMSVTQGLLMW